MIRGFTQEYGVDYSETFSPVVKFTSVRTILALAAREKLVLRQFDGELDEDVFMLQPAGYEGVQTAKEFVRAETGVEMLESKIHFVHQEIRFRGIEIGSMCFRSLEKWQQNYSGDLRDLRGASNSECMKSVIEFFNQHFEIKDFDAKCFLGLKINRRHDGSIHIQQASYTKKVLHHFRMLECNAVAVPADSNQVLCVNSEAIGSLMYLAIRTRPDISYAPSTSACTTIQIAILVYAVSAMRTMPEMLTIGDRHRVMYFCTAHVSSVGVQRNSDPSHGQQRNPNMWQRPMQSKS